MARFTLRRARAFAAQLDVDVGRTRICYACLCIVSFPLDRGDERAAIGEARSMTPILWSEGLAEPALALARDAVARGVRGAEAALAELEELGGRSAVARALVLRYAADLTRRTRVETALERAARPRLERAPPGLN